MTIKAPTHLANTCRDREKRAKGKWNDPTCIFTHSAHTEYMYIRAHAKQISKPRFVS